MKSLAVSVMFKLDQRYCTILLSSFSNTAVSASHAESHFSWLHAPSSPGEKRNRPVARKPSEVGTV